MVAPGDRGKSPMRFVDTAGNIEKKAMEICKKWPESYMFIITQRTIELASEIYEQAQKANAIIPQSEAERTERILCLERALGANYAFARKIERAYTLFPLCGQKPNRSENVEQIKSNKLLEEFMTMCSDEEDALKGNLQYTRSAKLHTKR